MSVITNIFIYFFIRVHRKLIGHSDVIVVTTGETFELTFNLKEGIYKFRSIQGRYIVKRTGLLKFKSIKMVYRVDLVSAEKVDNEGHIALDDPNFGLYFNLCPNFLKNTTYPHRLAIITHFYRIRKGKGFIPGVTQLPTINIDESDITT